MGRNNESESESANCVHCTLIISLVSRNFVRFSDLPSPGWLEFHPKTSLVIENIMYLVADYNVQKRLYVDLLHYI